MIPKINIKYLENDIYSITPTKNITSSISYIDFNYTSPQPVVQSNNILNYTKGVILSGYNTVSPNVYLKNIQLRRLEIPINTYLCNTNNTIQIFNVIKNEINKDAFKLMTSLGEKNRITAPTNITNLDIKTLKQKYNDRLSRSIISKFISTSNYIANQGRLGAAQYLISNFKTYNYILSNLDTIYLFYDKNGNLFIDSGHTTYLIDDLVDDDIIIFGRKNRNDQSGVHCAILTDENNDIIFQKMSSFDNFNTKLIMFYEVFDIGKNPEYQYIKINTRTLEYYRNKKLQRIKKLYEN
jgi:hypothetical protein